MEEDTLWWGTETWVPAQESDTEHFRPGFYRVDRRLSGSLSVPVLSLSNHWRSCCNIACYMHAASRKRLSRIEQLHRMCFGRWGTFSHSLQIFRCVSGYCVLIFLSSCLLFQIFAVLIKRKNAAPLVCCVPCMVDASWTHEILARKALSFCYSFELPITTEGLCILLFIIVSNSTTAQSPGGPAVLKEVQQIQ